MSRKPGSAASKPRRGFDRERAQWVASALTPWFLATQRDLSWRRTRDPYAVWVSEVMLQQTRVETVERYWSEFITRFPDVGTLAAAETDEVLAAWSGLGYYRRARLLHQGAKLVVAELGAQLPRDAEGLRRIPGIGAYTAGAIASIAYDQPEPLVDGNVARVLARFEAVATPSEQLATAPWLWDGCAAILREGSPRILGQALMELGATVCTPRAPRCAACPLAEHCRAKAAGVTAEIPAVRERAASPTERWWALALMHDDAVLLVQRGEAGLLARMWCLPLVAIPEASTVPDRTAVAAIVMGKLGSLRPIGAPVVHVFTHRRWEVHVVVASVRSATPLRDPLTPQTWLREHERPAGGLPTLTRKLLARVWAQATV